METIIVILVFALFIGLGGGAIFYSIHMEKKRRESFSQAAEEMGLTFLPAGSDDLFQKLSQIKNLNVGRSRKMANVIVGDSGDVKLAIFDYQYTVGNGKQTQTHKMTIVSIESGNLVCPPFSLRPEGFFDRIGGMLGFQDIDFESHPLFSKMFVLKSPDEQRLRKFMTTKLLDYFQGQPGISLEAENGVIFFFRSGKRCKPHELKDLFAQAYETYGKIIDS